VSSQKETSISKESVTTKPAWKCGLGLIILVFAAFFSSINNGWIWDDNDYVTQNEILTEEGGMAKMWSERDSLPQWYPLVHTTFRMEVQSFGTDSEGNLRPSFFHFNNVLLHALCAVVLWRLLRRLGIGGAWFIAALWALHPINVESVAWVTERKNVLSLLMALGSAHAFFGWLDKGKAKTLLISMGLFAAALLSKTVVASLPAVIMLLMWWREKPLKIKTVTPLLAMLAVGGMMGWQTALDEVAHVGAQGQQWDFSFVERTLIAARILWFYAGKLVFPYPLTFIYERWEIDASSGFQWLFPIAVVALIATCIWLWKKRNMRGPLTAVLCFGGVLFPALGYLNVYPHQYSFVADHFQHHAAPALIVLFGIGLMQLIKNPKLWAVPLVLLGGLSFMQGHVYEDEETLWLDVSAKNPTASIAHNNLAIIYHGRNQITEAKERFALAIKHNSFNVQAMNNLGQLLLHEGKLEEARPLLERAIETMPVYVKPYVNLGDYWRQRGQKERSVEYIKKALEYYESANELNQGGAIPFVALTAARLHAAVGDHAKAISNLEYAIRGRSTKVDATVQLMWMLSSHPDRKVRDGQRALQLGNSLRGKVESAQYFDALAAAFAESGNFEDAVNAAKQATFRAMQANQDKLSGEIKRRLDGYKAKQPARTKAGLLGG